MKKGEFWIISNYISLVPSLGFGIAGGIGHIASKIISVFVGTDVQHFKNFQGNCDFYRWSSLVKSQNDAFHLFICSLVHLFLLCSCFHVFCNSCFISADFSTQNSSLLPLMLNDPGIKILLPGQANVAERAHSAGDAVNELAH